MKTKQGIESKVTNGWVLFPFFVFPFFSPRARTPVPRFNNILRDDKTFD